MLEWIVKTQEESIVEERKRCEQAMYERQMLKRFDGFIPEWIPIWLAKSNKEHLNSDACKEECKSCGEYVDRWIETSFSFCNEYGCGISLCEKCAKILANKF